MSGVIQGFAAWQQGRADAEIGAYNAAVADQGATAARQQAGAAEEDQRREARRVMGAQRSAQASSGLAMDSGSALDVARESAVNAELDALNIRYSGELEAKGLQAQAANFRAQSKAARRGGNLGLAAGLLSTGEKAAFAAYGGG